jgi:hypothetical protein
MTNLNDEATKDWMVGMTRALNDARIIGGPDRIRSEGDRRRSMRRKRAWAGASGLAIVGLVVGLSTALLTGTSRPHSLQGAGSNTRTTLKSNASTGFSTKSPPTLPISNECTPSDVIARASFNPAGSGTTLGSVFLSNVGTLSCQIQGRPQVVVLAGGQALQVVQGSFNRAPGLAPPVTPITLSPGATSPQAGVQIEWDYWCGAPLDNVTFELTFPGWTSPVTTNPTLTSLSVPCVANAPHTLYVDFARSYGPGGYDDQ